MTNLIRHHDDCDASPQIFYRKAGPEDDLPDTNVEPPVHAGGPPPRCIAANPHTDAAADLNLGWSGFLPDELLGKPDMSALTNARPPTEQAAYQVAASLPASTSRPAAEQATVTNIGEERKSDAVNLVDSESDCASSPLANEPGLLVVRRNCARLHDTVDPEVMTELES